MADTEKIKLFELDIDTNKAVADTRALKVQLELLKESAEQAKIKNGELSDEYIEYQAAIKVTTAEIRTNEKYTQNLLSVQDEEKGSIIQLRKELAIVTKQWERLSEDERKNGEIGKQLTAEKLRLTTALKGEEKATGDTRRNVGNYTDSINEALGVTGQYVPVLGQASGAISGMGKAFTLALGPIGLVVATIGLVIAGLKAFFTASEEGQNEWSKFGNAASVVLGNVTDKLSDFGEAILHPEESLKKLRQTISDTFGNFFEGLLEKQASRLIKFALNIQLMAAKTKNLFTDNEKSVKDLEKNIESLNNTIEEGNEKMIKGAKAAAEAYLSPLEAFKNFVDETKREITESNILSERQAALDKQIRASIVDNARLGLEIAKIRNDLAQKEKFTAQERLGFIDEAIKKENQILANNLSIAIQEEQIAKGRAEAAKNNKDANDELARLEANVYNVRAANFAKTMELETQRVETVRSIAAEEKAIRDKALNEEEARIKEEQAFLDDFYASEIKQKAESVQQQIQIEQSLTTATEGIRAAAAQRRMIELDADYAANQDNLFRKLDIERLKLEEQYKIEMAFAQKIGADTTKIEDKFTKARLDINKLENQAKISLAAEFTRNIATIAGEGTEIGKLAAAAQTTILTYQGAQAAFTSIASTGTPISYALGLAAAAAALVAGFANVKKIYAVDSGLPSSGGGGSPSISATPAATLPTVSNPNVNQGIISRENINNNIEAPQPQQILVVDKVTKAQKIQDNNRLASTI